MVRFYAFLSPMILMSFSLPPLRYADWDFSFTSSFLRFLHAFSFEAAFFRDYAISAFARVSFLSLILQRFPLSPLHIALLSGLPRYLFAAADADDDAAADSFIEATLSLFLSISLLMLFRFLSRGHFFWCQRFLSLLSFIFIADMPCDIVIFSCHFLFADFLLPFHYWFDHLLYHFADEFIDYQFSLWLLIFSFHCHAMPLSAARCHAARAAENAGVSLCAALYARSWCHFSSASMPPAFAADAAKRADAAHADADAAEYAMPRARLRAFDTYFRFIIFALFCCRCHFILPLPSIDDCRCDVFHAGWLDGAIILSPLITLASRCRCCASSRFLLSSPLSDLPRCWLWWYACFAPPFIDYYLLRLFHSIIACFFFLLLAYYFACFSALPRCLMLLRRVADFSSPPPPFLTLLPLRVVPSLMPFHAYSFIAVILMPIFWFSPRPLRFSFSPFFAAADIAFFFAMIDMPAATTH